MGLTLLLLLVADRAPAADVVEVPTALRDEVLTYARAGAIADKDGAEGAAVARRLGDWIADASRRAPVGAVIDALAQFLPVRRNEQRWSWGERTRFRRSPPTTERFSMSVAEWQRGRRTVTVFTPHFVGGAESRPQLFYSSPLAVAQASASSDAATLEPAEAGGASVGVCGVMGFIEPPDPSNWPDVLIGWSAEGQVVGLQLRQMHRGDTAPQWSVVWQDEWVGVMSATFGTGTRDAVITWQDGLGVTIPYESYQSSVTFRFGRPAVEKQPQRID